MNSKTKSDLSNIKKNIDQIFNKMVTNPNITPIVTGIAISSVLGIVMSISSGASLPYAYPTKAIFWMRPGAF